jgi:hypothetical protein
MPKTRAFDKEPAASGFVLLTDQQDYEANNKGQNSVQELC